MKFLYLINLFDIIFYQYFFHTINLFLYLFYFLFIKMINKFQDTINFTIDVLKNFEKKKILHLVILEKLKIFNMQ